MSISKDSLRASAPSLATFLILTAIFYCVGYWLIFRLERASPLMMSVGLAALATCFIHGRRLSSLGLLWGNGRYQWISFLIPLGIATTAYLIIWGFGFAEYNFEFASGARDTYHLSEWNDVSIVMFHIAVTATFSLVLSVPAIFGEELAWRGFLVTELSKSMSFRSVALVSGLLWSAFHWPLMIRGFYGSEYMPLLFQVCFFTLFVVSNSVTMTYLRYKTDSVWSAVIFHSCSNIFIQKVFAPITVVSENSAWFVDEFGVVVPIIAFCVAIFFWKKALKEFV